MRTTKPTEQTTCTHSIVVRLSLAFALRSCVLIALQALATYNATKTMGKKFNCTGVADVDAVAAAAAAAIPIYILSRIFFIWHSVCSIVCVLVENLNMRNSENAYCV